jgi:hypothetical protein
MQLSVPNETAMAVPNVSAYSASLSQPARPTYNTADFQARLDALR